jgi:fructose-1-phosphate kinase PfkB-like protein
LDNKVNSKAVSLSKVIKKAKAKKCVNWVFISLLSREALYIKNGTLVFFNFIP